MIGNPGSESVDTQHAYETYLCKRTESKSLPECLKVLHLFTAFHPVDVVVVEAGLDNVVVNDTMPTL